MFSFYTTAQQQKWDEIVKSFNQSDVYWLCGYTKAFELHGDGTPLLLYYDDGKTRGINVVMKRDISKCSYFKGKIEEGKYYDLSTPYGYGGWIIEGDDAEPLFFSYEKWCRENNIISEFVRFHPIIKNQDQVDKSYDVVPLGNTVAMDITSDEIIWTNITSKNRNMIRKAQKNGIEIHIDNSPEIYETFKEIYNKTMDKDNADKYYYFDHSFYESIRKDLSDNAHVFYATYENKVIAASIILIENNRLNYHLSGSMREFSNLAPSNLLLYEAAKWGSNNGCKTFHLGGGVGSGEDSLFKFKRSFYREEELINTFCIGKKIFDEQKYEELTLMREKIDNEKFFPKYRG